LLKFKKIALLTEELDLWRTTMLVNKTSAVTRPLPEAGKQLFLNAEAKNAKRNGVSYARGALMEGGTRASYPTTGGPTQASSGTGAPFRGLDGYGRSANNKVILVGLLSRNAAVRQTTNGHLVANFSIEVDESYKDRQGERQKRTSRHRVQAWGELVETVGADLQEGVAVYVEGRLVNHAWVDRENRKHYYTDVVAKVIRFEPATVSAADISRQPVPDFGRQLQ
jgi:single stranded DNA-binding protein